jgi:uncharacterized membrane protein YeaQ/YmgE (transglycosylase-associated protein family)
LISVDFCATLWLNPFSGGDFNYASLIAAFFGAIALVFLKRAFIQAYVKLWANLLCC